ncbi:MAG: hypothetical protein MHM6MM_005754 [Cercozoa sp. M6MM]
MAPNNTSRETTMWVEKYRPESLDDVVSHEHIITTIQRLLDSKRLPHLLFYGPAGTGKTSTMQAIARLTNGAGWRSTCLELNASDDRGIDVVRKQIKQFTGTRQIFQTETEQLKWVILDEADAMTSDAQFALRRIIEESTKTTRFCIICNYVNRIIPALQSRCTKFRFAPLPEKNIAARLRQIASAEGVELTLDGREAIQRVAGGDMRRCVNILQATAMASGYKVDAVAVHTCTGTPYPADVESLWDRFMLSADVAPIVAYLTDLMRNKGYALADLVALLHEEVRKHDLPSNMAIFLFEELAELEHRLAGACDDAVQTASLVAVFFLARKRFMPSNAELRRLRERHQQLQQEENAGSSTLNVMDIDD